MGSIPAINNFFLSKWHAHFFKLSRETSSTEIQLAYNLSSHFTNHFFNHRARQKPLLSPFVCELDEGIKNFNTSPRFEKTLVNSVKGARRAHFSHHRYISSTAGFLLLLLLSLFMVTWRFSSRLGH